LLPDCWWAFLPVLPDRCYLTAGGRHCPCYQTAAT
jgi:hypothetical protein